jgi:hypothetical protein
VFTTLKPPATLALAFALAAAAFLSRARLKKNSWADFNVIWQECSMLVASHLINFWVTLTYFQGH